MTNALAKRPTAIKSEAGKQFPKPGDMSTGDLKKLVADGATQIAVRSAAVKPYYLELRGRLSQKQWDVFCRETFDRTRRAIDYWLKGGNPGAHPRAAALPAKITGELPECEYIEDFLTPEEADTLFRELSDLPWEQHIIPMYGKKIPAPRLFQWMGIPPQPKSYTGGTPIEGSLYGGTIKPIAWTPAALQIKAKVEAATGETFDSLNINYYRDHNDHLGWHVDKEDEGLWTAPIASVSLGAVRTFEVRKYEIANQRKKEPIGETYSLPLAHGSLVVMPAHFQGKWLHRLAPMTQAAGPRINLTFRRMSDASEAVDAEFVDNPNEQPALPAKPEKTRLEQLFLFASRLYWGVPPAIREQEIRELADKLLDLMRLDAEEIA